MKGIILHLGNVSSHGELSGEVEGEARRLPMLSRFFFKGPTGEYGSTIDVDADH